MAIEYANPDNKPFSSWIVSGKEAEQILEAVNNPEIAKKAMKTFMSNFERVKKVMSEEN